MRGILGGLVVIAGCTAATATTAPAPTSTAPVATASSPPAPGVSKARCNSSTECAADALCCPSLQDAADAGSEMPLPFGPSRTVNICATDPVRQCEGHELCGAGPCRSPWPPTRPMPSPARTHVLECLTSRDCPKDTTCQQFHFRGAGVSSLCVYNVAAGTSAKVAPACANDADCKGGARCADLANDFEHRRVCLPPGAAHWP